MEKGLKTLQTAGRAARRHSARHSSPVNSQNSPSGFEDSVLDFPHSPSVSSSYQNFPNHPQSQAPPSFSSYSLAPMSNQQRAESISSVSSAANSIPQAPLSHHAQQQRMSYPANASQPIFATTAPSSASYIPSNFNMNWSPTANAPHTLPSLSRGYEATSRPPQSLPPLLPSLHIGSTRSHHEPITASY